jgi:hypothetical protein
MNEWLPWLTSHPLLALAAMVGAALTAGWFAVHPAMSEIVHRNHPPC